MSEKTKEDVPSTSRGVAAPRRSGPSPRIQALATRFEASPVAATSIPIASDAQRQSRTESTRLPLHQNHAGAPVQGALGDMNWSRIDRKGAMPDKMDARTEVNGLRGDPSLVRAQPRQPCLSPAVLVPPSLRPVDASPVRPLANVSLEMGRLQRAKPVDGLPQTSGSTIPDFSSSPSTHTGMSSTIHPERPLVRTPSPESPDQGDEEKQSESQDSLARKPLIDHGKRRGASEESDSTAGLVQPVPAADVFKRDALPLFLPDLDDYLSDTRIFSAPKFTLGSALYTDNEALLYGIDQQDLSPSRRNFEVCGDQLSIPSQSFNKEGLRKRGKGREADQDVEEGRTLSEQHTLVSSGSSNATLVASSQQQKPGKRPPLVTLLTYSSGVPSSTKSRPTTRLSMFPPLMLLKDNSLDELKSNAVGPRKPPGGFLGSLPGVGSLLGTLLDFVIGVEGSSLAAGIFRLQLFMDFVQIMNLNLHFTTAFELVTGIGSGTVRSTGVRHAVVDMVPSLLALDFVSVFGAAVMILFSLMGFVTLLLLLFWRMTRMYNPNRSLEGFDSQPWIFRPTARRRRATQHAADVQPGQSSKQWQSTAASKFCNVLIVMLLNLLYIPLSKLAVDALVWNIDYWPVEAAPEGTGMCYKTTLDAKGFNWAYVIIPAASLTVLFYTLWFPFQMSKSIRRLLPRVNEFNELGKRRMDGEMETEYMRLLQHDASPLNFMYNAYRRRWGTYKPLYILCFKLSNLLVISVFTQQNCLFRHVEVKKMLLIQQSTLICLQTVLLVTHLFVQPFVDMLSNRSELVSRFGYVSTAILGLLVALQVEGSTVYRSGVLYTVQALTYSGNLYFSLAGTAWISHGLKRLQGRVDFSVDVFAPTLQVDKHIKRRVWQETLSTLLLSAPEYRMPIGQTVTFSVSDDAPPYLLQFRGTSAERHVENLKILRSIGMERYTDAVDMLRGDGEKGGASAHHRWSTVMHLIQTRFAGPDAYWQPVKVDASNSKALRGVTSFFGKAFLVPFPPTLVMRYDQAADDPDADVGQGNGTIQLTTLAELEAFAFQNESKAIQQRRWIRAVLRSLDGQKVWCPYVHVEEVSQQGRAQAFLSGLNSRSSSYTLAKPVLYEEGTLAVRRSRAPGADVDGYNFASGFDVFITYTQGQRRDVDGMTVDRTRRIADATAAFGLRDDFSYSSGVERLMRDNAATIDVRLPQIWQILQSYRTRFHREAAAKARTLSYTFLPDVFDRPVWRHDEIRHAFRQSDGCCNAVRHLPDRYRAACTLLVERLAHLQRSRVHKWWYVFWDDFWRQNNGDYAILRKHRQTFNPHFPTSLAYTPMSRDRLEALLLSKGNVWKAADNTDGGARTTKKSGGGLITPGLLNRIYFTLDEMAFDRSLQAGDRQPSASRGRALVVGTMARDGRVVVRQMAELADAAKRQSEQRDPALPRDMFSIPMFEDPFAATSRHTGGGTDENHNSIIERYAWPWTEQRLSGRPSQKAWKRMRGRILEWLSIRPYKLHDDIEQLYIYLCVVDGRYEAPAGGALK